MKTLPMLSLLCTSALLAACNVAPAPVAFNDEKPIRDAALQFTAALKAADQSRLQQLITVDPDPATQKLAQAVLADTLNSRQIQLELDARFHDRDQCDEGVGTDAWIGLIEEHALSSPIMQVANRVRIGQPGKEGTLFLRQIAGSWKVELIPSLVTESGGRTKLSDPLIDYRFNVTRAVNDYLLTRLACNEFASSQEFQAAKDQFWFQYMVSAVNGEDPQVTLLSSLPPLPQETNDALADDH